MLGGVPVRSPLSPRYRGSSRFRAWLAALLLPVIMAGAMAAAPSPFAHAADLLDPQPDPYAEDPAGWIRTKLGEHVWSKQEEICAALVEHPKVAVRSCHSSGKSFLSARLAAWWIDVHPPGSAFVVTTAPTFAQVRAILWRELGRAHSKGKLRGRVNQTEWWIPTVDDNEEIVAYGRKPADYDQVAFQGIHAKYVLVIVDEADGVPKSLLDAIEKITTNEYARILQIGNPYDPTGQFAKACAPGSGYHSIRISAWDTPNFTGEAIPDELADLLLAPSWVEDKRTRWGVGSPLWQGGIEAEFPEEAEDTLIPLSRIRAAQIRDLPESDPVELGVDVARYGSDKSSIYYRAGSVCRHIMTFGKSSTMETVGQVHRAFVATDATVAKIDVIGLGAGVYDRLEEQGAPVEAVNVGERADDPEQFVNRRAELYWGVRLRAEQGDLDLDPKDEDGAAQLSSIKWSTNSRGQVVIESKDDMKKRGLPSPDNADAIVLAFAPGRGPTKFDEATKQALQGVQLH